MPATLSAMPPAVAVATGGPPAGTARLAHAAQVIVPSGICAPHVLQNAIESSWVAMGESEGLPSGGVAETYQKTMLKAMNKSSPPAHGRAAYFSAKSPSHGSLKGSPCKAFTSKTAHRMMAASGPSM